MTLSAADAAAHVVHNPFTPPWLKGQLLVTLLLLSALGAVFLKGFKEAIGIAVVLVGVYLLLNAAVTVRAFALVLHHPELLQHWDRSLFLHNRDWPKILGVCLLLFPRLALGLSGFETGVAVMPLISGANLEQRIANTRKLLATAAIIMSAFLIATSLVTTLLIPPEAFLAGGPANGRALAYLAHRYMGNGFGTAYDISTILILAFAGASAMAGLLNLIPRYLPRFGMAPEWARAARPLVLVFTGVAFFITFAFHADVDAQGGAYATGVLVLITSAACAVTISLWRTAWRWAYLLIALLFVYTTGVNITERPEGLKISSIFIGVIIVVSLVSRALRSTELRATAVEFSPDAARTLQKMAGVMRVVPTPPNGNSPEVLDRVAHRVREAHGLDPDTPLCFLEVQRTDASEFDQCLCIEARRVGPYTVFSAYSPMIANSIAAFLIEVEKTLGTLPHAYFKWKEGSPLANAFGFVFLGEGDAAPVTHEVLRRAIPDPRHRPVIHVS